VRTISSDLLQDPALMAAFAAGLDAAATSCAVMTDGRLVVSSAEVRRLSLADVLDSSGGPEVPVAGLYVGFSGGLEGHGLMLLPIDEARRLAAGLVEGLIDRDDPLAADDGSGLAPIERSALEEIANVAVSSVLSSLGDELDEQIHPHVPVFVHDMAGAILDSIVTDAARSDGTVFAARTTFTHDGRDSTGVLLVVPRPEDAGGADPADRD